MASGKRFSKAEEKGDYEVWYLGDNKQQADELFELVLSGEKTATSYLYNPNDKPEDGYSILTNWDKSKQLLVQTTSIKVVPFNKVDSKHAYAEGEGDKSLNYWKRVHEQFFTKELKKQNKNFTPSVLIVCETFKVVMRLDGDI